MSITINGAQHALESDTDIETLLKSHGYADKIVAVAVNGTFVPKDVHAQTIITQGDTVEIVAPMQGG